MLQLRKLSNMSMELLILDCGTLTTPWGTMMLIRLATLLIEKAPRVGVSFLETTWFHGLEKTIIAYLCLEQR